MQPVVGDCARLICELTGNDRTAFCNTGSEAVMGAMRIARTVTGRSVIALFSGSYHGIFDEVIVRGTKRLRSIPAAPGILPESVENVLVLDYGTPESMAIIKERAHELAAVMVEPVQSRRPDFRPVEFLRELRGVTEQAGCAYIWDEVITGFRIHPGGAQAHFGVRADLVTYGKVVGGGMPFGVISGKAAWMDALDGGAWQFGDDSVPTVGVTYFAGTFVRHPLAMVAAKATLEHLKARGPSLQQEINERTDRLAATINEHLDKVGAPIRIKHFGSLWKAFHVEEQPMQDLLFCILRHKGIHIWDGFPCFLTEAHTDADVDRIIVAFRESVDEMQEAGFFHKAPRRAEAPVAFDASKPPVPGARLGRDPSGNPAWFVPNPAEQGKYLKVELS
jgi:glutamate-1-semialdehyde aminotransferase